MKTRFFYHLNLNRCHAFMHKRSRLLHQYYLTLGFVDITNSENRMSMLFL